MGTALWFAWSCRGLRVNYNTLPGTKVHSRAAHTAHMAACSLLQTRKKDRQECLSHRRRVGLAFPCFTSQTEDSFALRRTHRSALLEALSAKHRPPLRGAEGNRGFLPALRAVGLGLRAH